MIEVYFEWIIFLIKINVASTNRLSVHYLFRQCE